MSDILGMTSPEALISIMTELTVSSICYLILLLKATPARNFTVSITYSAIKLLGLSTLFVSNLNLLGAVRVPFLLGLLLNEVLLLVASIRNRLQFQTVSIRSMYSQRMLVLRTVGEVLTIVSFIVISIISPHIQCNCTWHRNIQLEKILGPELTMTCEWPQRAKTLSNVLSPQLRGLAFAIAVTASVVSVSGWQFMLMGFRSKIIDKDADHVTSTLRDAPWKKAVRSVYGYLTIVTVFLFSVSFFAPGFGLCINSTSGYGGSGTRYTMGPVSAAFLNAVLAISQMFVADMHVRLAALKEVEEKKNEDEDSDDPDGVGHEPEVVQWQERALSAMARRRNTGVVYRVV